MEFYRFIINFRYFIEVTTNFHLFMKLDAYIFYAVSQEYNC